MASSSTPSRSRSTLSRLTAHLRTLETLNTSHRAWQLRIKWRCNSESLTSPRESCHSLICSSRCLIWSSFRPGLKTSMPIIWSASTTPRTPKVRKKRSSPLASFNWSCRRRNSRELMRFSTRSSSSWPRGASPRSTASHTRWGPRSRTKCMRYRWMRRLGQSRKTLSSCRTKREREKRRKRRSRRS